MAQLSVLTAVHTPYLCDAASSKIDRENEGILRLFLLKADKQRSMTLTVTEMRCNQSDAMK